MKDVVQAVVERTESEKVDLCNSCWQEFVGDCEEMEESCMARISEHGLENCGLFPDSLTRWINETLSDVALVNQYGAEEDDDFDALRHQAYCILNSFLTKCWENYESYLAELDEKYGIERNKLRWDIYCVMPFMENQKQAQ